MEDRTTFLTPGLLEDRTKKELIAALRNMACVDTGEGAEMMIHYRRPLSIDLGHAGEDSRTRLAADREQDWQPYPVDPYSSYM